MLNSDERRFAVRLTAILTGLALLPTLVGALTAPAETSYTGLHLASPGDYPVYYGVIQQITDGHFPPANVMTSEPGTRAPISAWFWLPFSIVAHVANLDPRITLQLARLIVIPLGVLAWLWALKFWIPEPRRWRWASVFLVFAAGFGFWLRLWQDAHGIVPDLHHFAMDLWVSEGFNFLTLLHSPHMVASSTLIFLAFTFLARSMSIASRRDALRAGLCCLALGFVHPFHLITIASVSLVAFIVLVIHRRGISSAELGRWMLLATPAALGALVYGIPALTDSSVHVRYLQNTTLTTALWVTLISYGLLLPFAFVGAIRRVERGRVADLLLVIWFVVQAVLLYAPLLFQRRLTQGWQFPVSILAFEGLLALRAELIKTKSGKFFLSGVGSGPVMALLLIAGFSLSTVSVYGQEFQLLLRRPISGVAGVVFFPSDEVAAARWLHAHATQSDATIGMPLDGLMVAGLSGVRTYAGHGVETLNYDQKVAALEGFFRVLRGGEREQFMKARGLTYVIETPRSREVSGGSLSEPFLKPVFTGPTTTLYQVIP